MSLALGPGPDFTTRCCPLAQMLNYFWVRNERPKPPATLGWGGAHVGQHEGDFWGDTGGSALPKGAQLHHALLLELLRGLGPNAEQLGCSWLCAGRKGVKRAFQGPPHPHVTSRQGWARLGQTLTMLMGFRERW